MQNPFTLTFGKSPLEPVERPVQTNEIIDAFTADPVNQQMFIITGVRGSGKTVMLSKLNSNATCSGIIKAAKINLSFFGFGAEIEGSTPITDAETAIIEILERIRKKGNRYEIPEYF